MKFFKRNKKESAETSNDSAEERASLEDPNTPINGATIAELFSAGSESAAGVRVTEGNALTIPAMWAGVNFLASTIAGLPLHTYEKTEDGRKKVSSDEAQVLHSSPTEDTTSFQWRKYSMERTLLGGRSYAFIDRSASGKLLNLIALDPSLVTVNRKNGVKTYLYKENGNEITYHAKDIIDIPFMLKADGINHYTPVEVAKDALGLAIAATKYASKFFNDGGVPPFLLTGPINTPSGLRRAATDLIDAIKSAAKERRLALALPDGHDVKQIGVDPEKSQLIQIKQFSIEEAARILSLPPVFLQDLSKGTFSNTEQQDLQLVKHTIQRWVVQFEQELNLKLFGRFNRKYYVEFSVNGLLRGDFKTRLEGYAKGIQNAIYTSDECREWENLPKTEHGDKLMIQGATVPLGSQPNLNKPEA